MWSTSQTDSTHNSTITTMLHWDKELPFWLKGKREKLFTVTNERSIDPVGALWLLCCNTWPNQIKYRTLLWWEYLVIFMGKNVKSEINTEVNRTRGTLFLSPQTGRASCIHTLSYHNVPCQIVCGYVCVLNINTGFTKKSVFFQLKMQIWPTKNTATGLESQPQCGNLAGNTVT